MLWHLSTEQWIISFSFLCTLSYICGWISDRIMGYAGFGHVGNWIIMLVGVYVGMYSYNIYGYQLDWYPVMSVAVVFGSATTLLIFLATLKSALDA